VTELALEIELLGARLGITCQEPNPSLARDQPNASAITTSPLREAIDKRIKTAKDYARATLAARLRTLGIRA
jgi:hypothetical protein